MTLKLGKLFAVALVALALVASVAGDATAKKGKGTVGPSVSSAEIEDGTIACVDISAAVFPNGCPDDDSGGAPPPPPPPPGGGTVTYLGRLGPNQTKSVTVGNFTIRTSTDAAAACLVTQIVTGAEASRVADESRNDDVGVDDTYAAQAANTAATLGDANRATWFTAVTDTGTGQASGIVGGISAAAGCSTSGFVN